VKERCSRCGSSLRWARDGKCRVCSNNVLAVPKPWSELLELPGISSEIARALYAMGLRTVADVQRASDEVLLSVPGIGPVRVAKIRGLISNGR